MPLLLRRRRLTPQPAPPTGAYAPPPLPNLSTAGATTVGTGDNLAALVDAGAANDVFYFPNGTYTNVNVVRPKAGMRFIGQSQAGVILDGGGTRQRAFAGRSGSNVVDVVIANMTITNYGTPGGLSQDISAIDAKGNDLGYEGTPDKAQDWRIHHVTIANCANRGISLGDRWIIDFCHFENLHPQAIGGGKGVGGRITRNHFEKCGRTGAGGAGINYSAIKLALWNVGPHGTQGTETHQQLWQVGTGSDPLEPAAAQQTEPVEQLVIDTNTFDCLTPGFGPVPSLGKSRAIWFDIDARNIDVANNIIDDAYSGVFGEGCNNLWVHGNTLSRCGYFTITSDRHTGIYFGAAAIVMDSTTNTILEDNILHDCVCSLILFLGRRNGAGADWVTDGSEYALGGYIQNNFNVIDPADRSNVGSSNHTVRRNALTGSSVGVGMWLSPDINTSTETHAETISFEDNTYAVQTGSHWHWNGTRRTFAQWGALGHDVAGGGTGGGSSPLSTTADLLSSNEALITTGTARTQTQINAGFLPFSGASLRFSGNDVPVEKIVDPTAPTGAALRYVTRTTDPIPGPLTHFEYYLAGGVAASTVQAAWASAYYYFEPGFDFNFGGKTPLGLGGNRSGFPIPQGGANPHDGNGSAVRVMWRGPDYFNSPYPCLEAYAYTLDSATYGDEWRFEVGAGQNKTLGNPVQITTGVWYHVGIGIELWYPDGTGRINMYLDGVKLRTVTTSFKTYASQHYLNTSIHYFFSGGNTSAWIPSVNSYLRVSGMRYGTTPQKAGLPA